MFSGSLALTEGRANEEIFCTLDSQSVSVILFAKILKKIEIVYDTFFVLLVCTQ